MDHAVAVVVAHGDVDIVAFFCVGKGVEGGDEQLLVGQHHGGAFSLFGTEPVEVLRQQLPCIFTLQDVLRTVYKCDLLFAGLEEGGPRGTQLGEVFEVLLQEVSGFLVGFQVN